MVTYWTHARDAQSAEQLNSYVAEATNKNNWSRLGASVASVPLNLLFGAAGAVDAGLQKLTGNGAPVNWNSPAQMASGLAPTIRGAVSEHLEETTEAEFLGANLASAVYNLGMSVADSFTTAKLTGSGGLSSLVLGSSAATQGMQDAKARGATDAEAVGLGLLNGAFEALFEKVSIDRLLTAGDASGLAAGLRAALRQGGVEASEEVMTTLANSAADAVVMGDRSALETMVRQYMAEDLSETEARRRAWRDWTNGLIWDAIGGVASGGVMYGVNRGLSYATQRRGAGLAPGRENADPAFLAAAGIDVNENAAPGVGTANIEDTQAFKTEAPPSGSDIRDNVPSDGSIPDAGGDVNAALQDDGRYTYIDGADVQAKQAAEAATYDKVVSEGKTVSVPGDVLQKYRDINNNPAVKLLNAVKDYYNSVLLGTKVDVSINGGIVEVRFENDGRKKSVGWRMSPEKAATFEHIHRLFENAEYAYSERNRDSQESADVPRFNYFIANAEIDGRNVPVKLQVRDLNLPMGQESRYYTHTLQRNRGSDSPGTADANAGSSHGNAYTPSVNSSIPKPAGDVKPVSAENGAGKKKRALEAQREALISEGWRSVDGKVLPDALDGVYNENGKVSPQLVLEGMREAEAQDAARIWQERALGDEEASDIQILELPEGFSEEDIITDGSHLQRGKLRPNCMYRTGEHGYIYMTNQNGLIVWVRADDLQLKTHDGRLRHDRDTPGKTEGDQAGHLIGDLFGGSPELDNLVTQARSVNNSAYRLIENQWAAAIRSGQSVSVEIKINYKEGSARPASFEVTYTINGERFSETIAQ